jgi:hypothetical protein
MTRSTKAIERMSTRAKVVAGIATIGAASAGIFALGLGGTDLTLTAFSLSSNTADVDSGPDTVTCNMTITTTGAAVEDAGCTINPPTGSPIGCTAHSGAGDVWSCDVTFPRYAVGNTWAIHHLTIRDTNYVSVTPTNAELVADGPLGLVEADLDVVVTSTTPDTSGPVISSFTALPDDPNPGDTVTCTINATDTPAGIGDVSATFAAASEPYPLSCTGHGVTTCDIEIPIGADAGVTWNEVNHLARDTIGNRTLVEGAETFCVDCGCTGGAYDNPNVVVDSAEGWDQSAQQMAATTSLTAVVWAQSTVTGGDAGVGLTTVAATQSWNDLLGVVRFSGSSIEARDGASTYGCQDETCPTFVAGEWYKITFVANITAGTYDATVESCDGTTVNELIADDYAFHPTATWSPVAYYSVWNLAGGFFSLNTADGSWSPTCTPLTCIPDFDPDGCGFPDDGCGTELDCDTGPGTCDERVPDDVCDTDYQCCTPDASWCANEAPPKDCGFWPDNCGQSVDCGSCATVCNVGVCCVPESDASACAGLECGFTTNNCGQSVDCDTVTGGCTVPEETCLNNVCGTGIAKPTPANTGACANDRCGVGNDWTGAGTAPPSILTSAHSGNTYSNFSFSGGLALNSGASNITLSNFKISGGHYGIHVQSNTGGNILFEDGDITGSQSAGIYANNGFTARRLYLHDFNSDAMKVEGTFTSPALTEYSYVRDVALGPEAHGDFVQSRGVTGSNITFQYNNCDLPNPSGNPMDPNSCFMLQLQIPALYVVENNWLNGGGFTVFCSGVDPDNNVFIRYNQFGRDYLFGLDGSDPGAGCNGGTSTQDAGWYGNVWEDNGLCTGTNNDCP